MTVPESEVLPLGLRETPLRAGVWVAPQHSAALPWNEAELSALQRAAPVRRFGRGESVYHQGDSAEGLFLVLEGRVKLSTLTAGGERVLALCGPGDLFGMNRCAGERSYPAQAVSQSPETRLVSVGCAALRTALQAEPSLAPRLVGLLSGRIGALEEQLEQARLPAQARLARTLLSLSKRLGAEVAPGVYQVALELRHDEIASLAGTGRVSVTQALSAWRGMDIVSGTRGRYLIDVVRLEVLSEVLEAQAFE